MRFLLQSNRTSNSSDQAESENSAADVGIIVQKIKTRQLQQLELMYDMRRELESSSDLDGPNSMFLATDAVSWLVTSQHASNAGEAVAIGKQLYQDRLILPVQREINFQNIKRWWRFSADCEPLTAQMLFPTRNFQDLVLALSKNVIIKDRKYRMRTYRRCFVGSETVNWMISQNYAFSEKEGVLLGKAMETMGLIESAIPGKPYECAENCFFRIVGDAAHQRSASFFDVLRGYVKAPTNRNRQPTTPEFSTDGFEDECLIDVTVAMQQHIQVQTRRRGLKRYHNCFVLSDGIEWLIQSGRVQEREHARNRVEGMIRLQFIQVATAVFLSIETEDPLAEFYTFNKPRIIQASSHQSWYGKLHSALSMSQKEILGRKRDHQYLLDELKASLDATPGLREKAALCRMSLDDINLMRYLRCAEYQLNGPRLSVKQRIGATVAWFRKCDTATLTAEVISSEFDEKLPFYIRGRDREGRPIVYFRPGEFDVALPQFHRLVLFTLISCTQIADDKGICVIVDCLHSSRNLLPSSQAILVYAAAMFSYFPELLGRMFILNANRSIYAIWQIISHYVSRRTMSKITFLSHQGTGIRYALTKAIDTDALESQYHSGQLTRDSFSLSEYILELDRLSSETKSEADDVVEEGGLAKNLDKHQVKRRPGRTKSELALRSKRPTRPKKGRTTGTRRVKSERHMWKKRLDLEAKRRAESPMNDDAASNLCAKAV